MTEAVQQDADGQRSILCEGCGAPFLCRPANGGRCWCGAEPYRLPMPLPAGAPDYKDCLCPSCLRGLAASLAESHGGQSKKIPTKT